MNVILTARQTTNDSMFTDVLALYAQPGARVLDMTWGRGNFWTPETLTKYNVSSVDLNGRAQVKADFRALPFPDGVFDLVALDPPYARGGPNAKRSVAEPYGLDTFRRTLSGILDLYGDGYREAARVLRPGGVLVSKTQDQDRDFMHVDLMASDGFRCEDLFVLMAPSTPTMRHTYQKHARKNHSYFIVLRKTTR